MMRLVWTSHAWDDCRYWQDTDKSMVKRIDRLSEDCRRHPFEGIGKPEPLKHLLSGTWSRRIDQEHRFVYKADGDDLVVLQARFHYE
jgi:toxin YoeB